MTKRYLRFDGYGLSKEQAEALIEAGPETCEYFEQVVHYMIKARMPEDMKKRFEDLGYA